MRTFHQLTLEEREKYFLWKNQGVSLRDIGRRLGTQSHDVVPGVQTPYAVREAISSLSGRSTGKSLGYAPAIQGATQRTVNFSVCAGTFTRAFLLDSGNYCRTTSRWSPRIHHWRWHHLPVYLWKETETHEALEISHSPSEEADEKTREKSNESRRGCSCHFDLKTTEINREAETPGPLGNRQHGRNQIGLHRRLGDRRAHESGDETQKTCRPYGSNKNRGPLGSVFSWAENLSKNDHAGQWSGKQRWREISILYRDDRIQNNAVSQLGKRIRRKYGRTRASVDSQKNKRWSRHAISVHDYRRPDEQYAEESIRILDAQWGVWEDYEIFTYPLVVHFKCECRLDWNICIDDL